MYNWWFLVNLMGRATITAIQFGGISIILWRFLGVHILESHPRLRIWVGSVPCEWFCFVALGSYFGNNVRNRWRGLDSVHASWPPRPPPHEAFWMAPRHHLLSGKQCQPLARPVPAPGMYFFQPPLPFCMLFILPGLATCSSCGLFIS